SSLNHSFQVRFQSFRKYSSHLLPSTHKARWTNGRYDQRMRTRTLLTQVLAVNSLLVAMTAVIAAAVTRDRLSDATSTEGLLLLALAVFSAVLLNSLLIRYRLEPMERLVRTMD